MIFFTRKKQIDDMMKEIRDLKLELSALKKENEIRIGDFNYAYILSGYYRDDRPLISLKDALKLIMKHNKIEIEHNKGTNEFFSIKKVNSKPSTFKVR